MAIPNFSDIMGSAEKSRIWSAMKTTGVVIQCSTFARSTSRGWQESNVPYPLWGEFEIFWVFFKSASIQFSTKRQRRMFYDVDDDRPYSIDVRARRESRNQRDARSTACWISLKIFGRFSQAAKLVNTCLGNALLHQLRGARRRFFRARYSIGLRTMKNERIPEFWMHERTNLVELRTVHLF